MLGNGDSEYDLSVMAETNFVRHRSKRPATPAQICSCGVSEFVHHTNMYQSLSQSVNYIFSGTSIPIVARAAVRELLTVSATDIRTARLTTSGSGKIL